METICHMGTTLCVFKKKKGPMFKKQKAAREAIESTCWGGKKIPGAQFIVCVRLGLKWAK